ncbi:uncharacterized protein LOC142972888 isoform X3 [Anticarsia gemmatalis]|uniref:uncharacterized protein LOC142972888 isoform X3 n=1 Tax=Anticarsia gemmatalis TaxID=129554 RepID=UPI003F75FFAB
MLKPLLVLAAVANTFFITPSEGSPGKVVTSSSSSSSSSSNGGTSYSSSSSSTGSSSSFASSFSRRGKPRPKCPKPNEVYDKCPVLCPPQECGVDITVILCAVPPKPGDKDCKPGCRCRDGYLRNATGICVDKDDCPKCPPNEVYDICPAPCPPRRCDVDDRLIRCAAPPKPGDAACEPGCRCVDGYVRNNKGVCVTRDQCPKCTKPHEVYDRCPPICPPQTCEGLQEIILCPNESKRKCQPACRCEPGYYRNKIGECISEENCRKCPGEHEYFSCGGACDNVCATLSEKNQTNCDIFTYVCTPMCYCEEGYARDDNNVCIPIDQCKVPQCGDHEILSDCPSLACRPLSCSEVGFPVGCPVDDSECPEKPACICEDGYVKNATGQCIPIKECPSCGGDTNAVSGCGVHCGNSCSDYKKKDVQCIEICYENACDCKKGFVYDETTKKCVRPKECPPTCGKNEVYSNCSNHGCITTKCSQLGLPLPQCFKFDTKNCVKGCMCKDNYVRADNGTCIPKEQCPSCGGDPNAVSGCGTNCGRRCSDIGKGPVACPAICNTNGCDCKPGFVLDGNKGKCVLPKDCSPRCGKNEVFSNCTNGGCGPKECSGLGFKIGCVKMDQKYCKEGCLCKDGYLRDDNGVCIPKTECPECGGDPNAVSGCGVNCNRHCSDIGQEPQSCITICYDDACDCRKGFVLDDNTGLCVRPENCTSSCGLNEVYNTCANSGCRRWNCSQPYMCLEPDVCEGGCICKDKYARADNGTCIPEEQCNQCTKANEYYDECAQTCPPQTCESIGKTYNCPIQPLVCRGACRCIEGYYRNQTGDCIPQKDCPPSCGMNEEYNTCANGGCRRWNCSQYILCIDPLECKGGCICIEGYSRTKNGTCIPENQCPGQCTQPYEYYDECPPTCPPQTCDSIIGKKIYNCPIQPAVCKGACRCEKGYYRNKIGNCISEEDCKKCTGPNEFFSCGGACDNVCATLNKQNQTNCPIINIKCNPMCYCEEGYARDSNNICIPIDQCPPPQCKDDERYEECPDNLCTPLKCSELGYPVDCPALSGDSDPDCPGEPACICDNDQVRDDDGNCIPKDQCPSCGGDPNAVSGCGNHCGNQCSDYNKTDTVCTLICFLNGCDCREGFVYDENLKSCVRPEDCTPTCGINEVYDKCGNSGCRKWTCADPILCIDTFNCEGRCVCKDGYSRADNGTCIPEDQCPIQCNNPHEYYDECPPSCPPQICELVLGRKYKCPAKPPVCEGACRCKTGYYRNKIGECISEEECKKCPGDHEYFTCGGACDNVCATLNKQNQTNCPIINIQCNSMCYCEKDYARDSNNVCIPIDQCPAPQCKHDERYEECPDNLCTPLKCSDLGYPVDCPGLSGNPDTECPGGPGCICDNNQVRDDDGNCIPKDQCPSCGGDPNAVSGCGVNCGKRCSNYKKKNVICPLICQLNGCDCREGYVYDDNLKKCVLPEDCTPTCGVNEVYDGCGNSGCRKWNCSLPILCIDTFKCEGRCVCQDGYSRAKNGTCIPEDQCPVECNNPHEYYDECPPTCPPQICELVLGRKYKCPAKPQVCEGACRCETGYYRNKIGECISEKECKKCRGPHEYFSCGGACDNVCATIHKQNQTNCPIVNIQCNPMCYCEKGYARDDKNICIPIEDCPEPQCGPNQRFEQCPDALCTPQTCSELGFPIKCVTLTNDTSCPGPPDCVCDYDFVMDDSGDCIPVKDCPSCGGDPNAVSGCGINCGRLCSNYDKGPVPCPRICKVNACDCRDGYVFDENIQKCVRPEQCTPVCGKNEVYSDCINGGCQPRNCSQFGKDVPCVKMDPDCCIKGCVCKEKYLRADNGTCIPEDQCKPRCNKPHEYYDGCAPTCPPQTCDSIIGKKIYHCPIQPAVCKGACRCEKGYYRNKIGECIKKEDCLKCTGPNEYFSCGSACDNVCATLHEQNQTNCPIINIKCNPKCYCEKGYARNDKNICIPIDQCPEPECGEGQRYEKCPDALCEPLTCADVGFPVACPDYFNEASCPGPPQCVCTDNKVKDDDGNCIPRNECPSCGGDPNAVSGCGGNCGRRCSDNKKKFVACPLICGINECDCKDGFVYDDNLGYCVRPEDCTPTCGKDEVFDTCANGGCDKRNCSQLGKPKVCIDPIECEGGCVCRRGYLRAKNGTCIPENKCPAPCKKPHEVYDACPPICPPQTCESIGKYYPCPFIPPGNTDYCNGACRCEEGYFRNKIGECILERDCLKCTGPNEYFSCGSACDNVCATLSQQNQTHCPIVNVKCNPMCYCEQDYARDKNGICIPADECGVSCKGDPNAVPGCGTNCGRTCADIGRGPLFCPAICIKDGCNCKENYVYDNNVGYCVLPKDCTPTCGDNEVFNECINGGCGKKNCSQLGTPDVCVRPKVCIKGCSCVDGYLRHDNGTCVPIDQCEETCNGDPNAEPGCGINCGRLCSNYMKPAPPCAPLCEENGCDCKSDYVFDNNIGKCVLPQDCTPVCEENEVYNNCSNNGCTLLKCSELLNSTITCDGTVDCVGSCVCMQGYLRDEDGVCVPEHQCNPQCGPNEVYNSCPTDCPPNTCESIGKEYSCPFEDFGYCEGRCVCDRGYYRNQIGQCITKDECLQCTGPNEFFACGAYCDNVCATLSEQNQTYCPVLNKKCNPMCYCEEGYARDDNNVCIPMEECPGLLCGPNERYEERPSFVCDPLYCSEVGIALDCPPVENPDCDDEPACICKQDYVRNGLGICVPKTECPVCGGDPNAVSGCGVNCGRTCSTYCKKEVSCIQICDPNGCDCREGFVYDEVTETCVRPDECCNDCIPDEEPPPSTEVNVTEAKAKLDRGSIALSGEFLYQLSQEDPDKNFATSPTSIMNPLALITLFARPPTALEQLLRLLNLDSKDEIRAVYKQETAGYKEQMDVVFEIATKYYFNIYYKLSQGFEDDADKIFDAGGESIDFSDNVGSAQTMNDWVANRTNNRIKDLISPDAIDGSTVMVLLNAVYFLGNWIHQFNPDNTQKQDFTKRNGDVVQVDMMYQENTFNYAEDPDLKIQALEMIYKGNNFSCFIILPEQDQFDATIQALRNPDVFQGIIDKLSPQKVQVSLPKIKIESSLDMGKLLKQYNVTEIFNCGGNSFEGILENETPLCVTDAVQKVFINIDETGTEAAAATGITFGPTAVLEPPIVYTFIANRPYIFVILYQKVPMFSGCFVGAQ